jgi:hypothetical protein
MKPRLVTAALLLVAALAAPAAAAPAATDPAPGRSLRAGSAATRPGLPIRLAATAPPAPWFTSGIVAGRFGGVPVIGSFIGTSAIGILTLTVHGATFAYGAYACPRRACTFTGILAGVRVRGVPIPVGIRGAAHAAAGIFPTPGSWIGAVERWAQQHLTRDQERRVLAEVARTLRS